MTKTIIKDYLKQIEKYHGKLITMNSRRYMPTGMKGFPDHIIFYKGIMLFIEVKIGKDKISPDQVTVKDYLKDVAKMNDYCFYIIATETNYKLITECLIQWNLNGLSKL